LTSGPEEVNEHAAHGEGEKVIRLHLDGNRRNATFRWPKWAEKAKGGWWKHKRDVGVAG